jgi:HEAT repeat protein
MRPGWLLGACALALAVAGCMPDVAAGKAKAARLLDVASIDSARALVSTLARHCRNDTGVLALQVRLYSAERRLLDATDALRLHDSLAGAHDSTMLMGVLEAAIKDADVVCAAVTIRACGDLACAPAYALVRSALYDRSPMIRRAAVYAIPRYERDDAVYALASAILDDEPMVRGELLKSAARLGDRRMLDLTRILQLDDNDGVIWCFINMRAALGDKEMRAQIRKELSGDLQILKVDAAATLALLGEVQQLRVLAEGLRSGEDCTRGTAIRALGDLKADAYVDTLIAAAVDKSDLVRDDIAYALGELGDARALPALERLMHDSAPYVRASALVALTRLRPAEHTASAALADSSLAVRAAAIAALLDNQTRPAAK